MFKRLAVIFVLMAAIICAPLTEAKTKKKKGTRGGKTARSYKPTKHSRKSRRYRPQSKVRNNNGPDLKTITTESPYKEDPSNGVTPVETKQPAL